MVIFHYDGDIILWSPVPYNKKILESAIAELTTAPYTIKYVFNINTEHHLCAQQYKEIYPDVKLIGPEGTPKCELDISLTNENAMKIIKGKGWATDLKITDKSVTNNLELIYNPFHKNKELVLFDKSTKTLFLADLIFNLGIHGTTTGEIVLEQYSPEFGFPKGFNPHGGWSYLTRYFQPESKVGKFFMNRLQGSKQKEIIGLINSWDYKTIVMVHGEWITKNAKQTLSNIYV
ncbi:hypothetical protein SBY92_002679 [Candida maltosa Xu316]